MKTVYLLRHAKSSWKDDGLDDIDRPLSGRGRRAASDIGRYLASEGVLPAQILCSPSRRTRETLERLHRWIGSAVPTRYEKGIYMAEAPALLRRLRRLNDQLSSVMVIGHNPGLESLALTLAGNRDDDRLRLLAHKFPTGALAAISADLAHWRDLQPGGGRLMRFVRPKDLEAEAG